MSKIMVVANEIPYPPHRNGVCSTLYNFIRCWYEMGHEVSIKYLTTREIEYEQALKEKYNVECECLELLGKEVLGKINGKFVIKPRNCWWIETRRCKKIQTQGYQYLVLGSFQAASVINCIERTKTCRVIFFEADSLSMFYKRNMAEAKSFLRKLYLFTQKKCIEHVEKKLYQICDTTSFVSSVDYEYAQDKFANGNFRVNRIACSVLADNRKVVENEENKECFEIGFSGIMDYSPNVLAVDYIIEEIMPCLDISGLNYRMHLIGKNPLERWKENQYYKDGKLIITGFVDNIDLYIKRMDLYVSPLFLGTGMKNKILQAMGIGVPMICSEVSTEGISELVDGENYIQCGKDTNEWRDSILMLSKDCKMRHMFSESCKKIIQDVYSWETSAKELLEE